MWPAERRLKFIQDVAPLGNTAYGAASDHAFTPWSEEEDQTLLKLVNMHRLYDGTISWTNIPPMEGRTIGSMRNRMARLDTVINKTYDSVGDVGEWFVDQDALNVEDVLDLYMDETPLDVDILHNTNIIEEENEAVSRGSDTAGPSDDEAHLPFPTGTLVVIADNRKGHRSERVNAVVERADDNGIQVSYTVAKESTENPNELEDKEYPRWIPYDKMVEFNTAPRTSKGKIRNDVEPIYHVQSVQKLPPYQETTNAFVNMHDDRQGLLVPTVESEQSTAHRRYKMWDEPMDVIVNINSDTLTYNGKARLIDTFDTIQNKGTPLEKTVTLGVVDIQDIDGQEIVPLSNIEFPQ